MIPQSRMHPGFTQNVMPQFLPRAQFRQADPLDFTARGAIDEPIDSNQYFGRVDHYFSEKDRIFGRIALDRSSRDQTSINPNFPRFLDSDVTNIATQWIHTFSPVMINEFRFGFNFANDDTTHPRTNDESFDMDALGVGEVRVFGDGNRPLTPREHGLMDFTGFGANLREATGGNGFDFLDTYQMGNHLSYIRGSHNFKFGGEWYHIRIERGAANLARGRYTFGNNESGNGFASALLGLPRRTETAEGLPLTFPHVNRLGFYINDDWKVTPRLTLNWGLRYDYNGNPVDQQGLQRTLDFPGDTDIVEGRGAGFVDPATGQVLPTVFPEFVDERGAVKTFRQQSARFFMPRLGIAYRATDKWVFRMGAGWFDNLDHQNTWTILNLMPPKSGSLRFSSVTDRAQNLTVTGADGRDYSVQTRMFRPGSDVLTLNDPFLQEVGGEAPSRPVNVLHVPPDRKDGNVWKWSFDIQRELPGNIAFTVGYVGSKGSHVGSSVRNYNNARPSPDTDFQSRRPFPRFYDPATPELGVQDLAIVRYLDSFGETFHHGLQVKLDRRYSNGLALGLAYTFSKSHGDGENGGQEGANYIDPFDRRGSRGRFRFDQRHNFVGHYVWEIPGANLQSPLRHVIGGWQTNGIVSLRSGFPFSVRLGGDPLNLGRGSEQRPDRIEDGRLDDATRKLWYNPQAFRRVTCQIPERQDLCRFGTAGENILESPGQANLDFSIYKNFRITEGSRLQFRAEFFNAFNTPYFGQPGGISFSSIDTFVPDGARNGEIRSIRTPMRIIQFGLKFSF